jgi:hypothetical protein
MLSLALGITFQTPDETLHGQAPGIEFCKFFLNRFKIAGGGVVDAHNVHV